MSSKPASKTRTSTRDVAPSHRPHRRADSPKTSFRIDLDADTVTCPNEVTVTIRRGAKGNGIAYFADACTDCPRRDACTDAAGGRTIRVGIHEAALARARERQQATEWRDDYRATRPKVERKLGHLMRRRHGGRRARVRGTPKVDADFNLLAAAANIARLAVLGLRVDTHRMGGSMISQGHRRPTSTSRPLTTGTNRL